MGYWPDDDHQERRAENRRTGPDTYTKFTRFASFLSWMMLILVGLFVDAATPTEFNIYLLDEKWGKNSDIFFRENYIYGAFVFCILTFIFVLIALIVDSKRQKRKTDHYSYALLAALIVSVIALFAFAIYFLV